MSSLLSRKDWREQATNLLRQVAASRLDVPNMFPNKEHVVLKEAPSSTLRENLHKFFAKKPDSLVQIETLSALLRQTPPEVIQEGDKQYKELKRLQQQTLYVQLQAKGFLDSREKTYSHTKLIVGDTYAGGVGFPEAEKLKAVLDENRSVERTLATNSISMEQLEELEAKLKADGSVVDPSFGKLITDKKAQFEALNNQLMQLLSKNSLKSNELRRICEIWELSESIKFSVNHHRHVKDIRDSFRWAHLLELFFNQSDQTAQKFREMAEKIVQVDTKKPLDLERLKTKLTTFAEGGEQDAGVFQALLEPVKSVESTDTSIQALIDTIHNACWSTEARAKLSTRAVTADELETLFRQAPASKKQAADATFMKVKELHGQMRMADNQTVLLLKELREFAYDVDDAKIKSDEGKSKMAQFNKKLHELLHIYDVRLASVAGLKSTERFAQCEGLLAALNCASAIVLRRPLAPDQLESADAAFETDDADAYRDNSLLQRVFGCLADKKLVDEFLGIVEQAQGEGSTLDDKVAIDTARKYIEIMKSEESPVSYAREIYRVDSYVERFEAWDGRCLQFVDKYSIDKVEDDFEKFVEDDLETFQEEYDYLIAELKELHFYSDSVAALQALKFSVDSLLFLHGPKRPKEAWQGLLARGEEIQETVPERFQLVQAEIAKAAEILEVGAEVAKEKPSYLAVRRLRELIPECRVDLEDDLAACLSRLDEEELLAEKIDLVLSVDYKLRLSELEKTNEEVKASSINFEEVGKKVDHATQICRAFMSAVRDMRKEARDIKKAAQLYLSLPLFSPSFEAILLQLIEEEETLEALEGLLSMEADVADFDLISSMEARLAQVKYYDVERPKVILFKKKVTLLAKISRGTDTSFQLPYLVVRSMRQECHELTQRFDNDEELELLDIFLGDVDNEAREYLNTVAQSKVPIQLDKVRKTVMNFVDVSTDIAELHAKAKGKAPALMLAAMNANAQKAGVAIKTLLPVKPNQFPAVPQKPEPELVIPSYVSTLAIKANGAKADTLAMREGLAAGLKIAWLKNPFATETDVEWVHVSHALEKAVHAKAEPGTYVAQMQKMLKLVQNLSRLKRITTLAAAKRYNVDLLLAFMELPVGTLIELENDKDKLLKMVTQACGHGQPAPMVEEKVDEKSRMKQEAERDRVRRPHDTDDIEEVHRDRLESLDNYRIAKIKPAQTDDCGKGMEDLLKDADRVVESLKDQLKSIHDRKDVDLVSEGSRHEDQKDSYRIKKIKKASEPKVHKEMVVQPKIEEGILSKIPDQPVWSVYKGTITFEMRGLDGMIVQVDYCDMITIESKNKVMNFPKLPEKLDVKGPFEHQDFVNQIEKLVKKPSKLFGFLFGILKSNDSVDTIVRAAVKSNCTFYTKYNQNTKLFIFPKSMFNKSWHDGLDICSRKIYHSNAEMYWLIAYHLNPAEKNKPALPMIDPHPIYSQNYFDLAAYQGTLV